MSFKMKALVTGGAGFIGSCLALELEAQGHEVVVVDNFFSGTPHNLSTFRGQILKQNIADSFSVDFPVHVIFHQAALTDPRFSDDSEMIRQNVQGFKNVLELALRQNAKLIYASTAGLYGNGPIPMQEEQPIQCVTAYGRSKWQMDEMALTFLKRLPIVGLRYFNVFGPHETHKGRPASMVYHLWKQMSEGKKPRIFKWGEHVRDFIYVKDAVRANLCALTGQPGIYNVGTGVGTSFNQVVGFLNEALKTDLSPDYFDMPFEGETYQHNTVASTAKAEKYLGFKAQWSTQDGIKDYVKFLESTKGSHT